MVLVKFRVCAEVGLDDVAAFLVHCYVGLSRLEPVEHLDGGRVNAFLFKDGDLFLPYIVSSEACEECDASLAEYSGGGDGHGADGAWNSVCSDYSGGSGGSDPFQCSVR